MGGGSGNKFGKWDIKFLMEERGKREGINNHFSKPGEGRENAGESICVSRGPSMSSSTRLTAQTNGLMPSSEMFPPSGGSGDQAF